MSQVTPQRIPFGDQLRQDLSRQKVSIKELGRRLNPEAPEIARRQLHRYLVNAVRPRAATRAEIAEALGFARDYYASDDDEEEDQVAELFLALLAQIKLEIHEAVDRRLGVVA